MRESNTAKGRSRREQVLDAALEAFADRGYRGASMASIAERVGLTEPGLLHHFASKPELLRAVIEHHEKLQTERFFAVGDRSLAEALLDLARHHEADPRFIRFFTTLAAESVNPDHPAHDWCVARYRRVRGGFGDAIRAEQAAGRMRPELQAEELSGLLVAVLDGLELQYLLDPDAVCIVGPLRTLLGLSGSVKEP